MAKTCNICGGASFVPGPKGRLSKGNPVKCESCGSLERHRTIRRVWNAIPKEYVSGLDVLQFADDVAFDRPAARSFELSIYRKQNSLDIQAISRPDEKYGAVIANHVLEHVPNATRAVEEMLRVTKKEGVVQLTVPGLEKHALTNDWGFPNEGHKHFRAYGADFPYAIGAPIMENYCVMACQSDDVTGKPDWVFLITKSADVAAFICKHIVASGIAAMMHGASPVQQYGKEARQMKLSLTRRFEELAALTRMLKQKEQELETTAIELRREQEAVRKLQSTVSWRITAPLRQVMRLIGKIDKLARAQARDVALVRACELFDASWYLRTYPDVARSGMDPAEHYLCFGAAERRDPGPGFDTGWYLETNPDVARSGVNPLVHYLRYGKRERRKPRA